MLLNLLRDTPPKKVFTPRSNVVNNDMYIHRSEYETGLSRWLDGYKHGFLSGESGTGKTWLYKRVFDYLETNFVIANCSLVSSKGSVRNEIYSAVCPGQVRFQTNYTESKKAEVSTLVANGSLESEKTFLVAEEDLLIAAFEKLSSKSKKSPHIIVLDNIETIFDNVDYMNELADIIMLLDDDRYSKYNVLLLLVGTPHSVIQYFSKLKTRSSVSNRIQELPIVKGFRLTETQEIVERGFNQQLDYNFSKNVSEGIAGRVHDVTLGIPQHVHEYCMALNYALIDSKGKMDKDIFDKAEDSWLKEGIRDSYSVIEKLLTGTSNQQRRNQVLYAIGKVRKHEFSTTEIANKIKIEFPDSIPKKDSGVGRILSILSQGNSPFLTKADTNYYSITDPRHIMCLRIILAKCPKGTIIKKGFLIND